MEDETKKISEFAKNLIIKSENKIFIFSILMVVAGYVVITVWLNAIRAHTSLWFVWTLIIIQFILYFKIFVNSYRRYCVFGFDKKLGALIFTILAFLGRVNNLELWVIPLLLIVMIALSLRNNKISNEKNILFENN